VRVYFNTVKSVERIRRPPTREREKEKQLVGVGDVRKE